MAGLGQLGFNMVIRLVLKTLLAIIIDLVIFVAVISLHWYYNTEEGLEYRINAVYAKLVAQTGQTQDTLPLRIVVRDTVNAYNDGNQIVIFTGLAKTLKNDDEIALVLGHEIAHGMLGHLSDNPPLTIHQGMAQNDYIAVLEGSADKMGAVYMIKAGYDICKGREIFKRWYLEEGNFIGMNHPDNAYRYEELNLGCE